jgi:hypothetical protein
MYFEIIILMVIAQFMKLWLEWLRIFLLDIHLLMVKVIFDLWIEIMQQHIDILRLK